MEQNTHDKHDVEAAPSSLDIMSEIASFVIDDDDDDDDDLPYDTISMDGGDSADVINNNIDEFALALRTSEIISGYRDYLSEMETVTLTNQRLANEMSMLRDSLGVVRGGGHRDDEVRARGGKLMNVSSFADIDEEGRRMMKSNRHGFKKRVTGLTFLFVFIVGIIVALNTAISSLKGKKDPGWDEELADEEWTAAMRGKQSSKNEWMENELGMDEDREIDEADGTTASNNMIDVAIIAPHSGKLPTSDPLRHQDEIEVDYGPGMKMIEEIIAHPGDIELRTGRTSKSGKVNSMSISVETMINGKSSKGGGSKSQKISTLSMSLMSTFPLMPTSQDSSTEGPLTIEPFSPPITEKPSSTTDNDESRENRLHLEEAGILYQTIEREYDPIFYDRSMGWSGNSYPDAAIFCASHYPYDGERVGLPCPFEVYCPEGSNSMPYRGFRSESAASGGVSYAPIMDGAENWLGWVQLSEGHSCVAYNYLSPEPTSEETGTIMCCKDTGL
ncbi:hypothetical protein ACHAXA_008679 [Cyclostephanos tholiformis]|uniref:DUF7495 domain-containing protein n=1 Tax=Cyclostephanos tholiformis TaxID=382380 RepID=A0ABD3RXA8_9STRA